VSRAPQIALGLLVSVAVVATFPRAGDGVPVELTSSLRALAAKGHARTLEEVKARSMPGYVGQLDRISRQAGGAVIDGWAADLKRKVPARRVHIFVDGRSAAVVVPEVDRPDVAAAFATPNLSTAGFHASIGSTHGNGTFDQSVEVFAELQDGTFAEIAPPAAPPAP